MWLSIAFLFLDRYVLYLAVFLALISVFFLKIQNTHLAGKKVEVKSDKLNVFFPTICHLQCSRECSREKNRKFETTES